MGIINEAQALSLQASFKVLCQVLLQLEPGFDVQALGELITIEIVDVAILEVEAECEAGEGDMGNEGLIAQRGNIEGALNATAEEAKVVRATLVVGDTEAVEMTIAEVDTKVVEVTPTEKDTELAKTAPEEATD